MCYMQVTAQSFLSFIIIIIIMDQKQNSEEGRLPTSVPGNASNPPANGENTSDGNQLLGKKAEKYLREVANIEDMPDEEEWQDAEKIIEQEKGE